jgi:thioredoxin-related protein/YHS domain-containing protein
MPLALSACLAVALANSSVAQDRIPWVTDLKVARQMAEQQQRLVLLHFWSETCGPCQKLERTVFNQPEFIRAISGAFIPVKINTQQSQDLAKYYQITVIPTDVVVDPTGKEVFRGTSPQNAASYIAVLDGIKAHNNVAQQVPADLIASTSKMLQSPWGQPQNATGGNNAAPPALIGATEQPATESPAAAPLEPSRPAYVENPQANANQNPNANPLFRNAPDAPVNNFAPRYSNQDATPPVAAAPATEQAAPAAQPASRFGQLAAPAALAAAAASQFGQPAAQAASQWTQPATQAASKFAQNTNQAASQFSQTASQATQAASQFAQNTMQASQSASQFGQNSAEAAKSASQFLQNPTQAVSQFEQNTTQAAQAASQFAQNTTQASQSANQFAQPVAQAASKFGPNAAQAASQFEQKTSQTAQAVSQFGQNAAQAASQFAQGTTQAASQFTAPAATPASQFQASAAEAPQAPGNNLAGGAPALVDNASQPQAPAASSMNRAAAPMSQPWDAGRNSAPAANADPQAGLRPSQPSMAAPAAGQPQLALDGFCSVSLVEQSKWTKGDPRWGAVHKGRVYLFGSAQAQQQFMSNPDRYSPMLAGNDIVRFAENGQAVEGKREHGVYYRDRILLFSDEESLQRFGSRPDYYLAAAEQAGPGQSASPVR